MSGGCSGIGVVLSVQCHARHALHMCMLAFAFQVQTPQGSKRCSLNFWHTARKRSLSARRWAEELYGGLWQ